MILANFLSFASLGLAACGSFNASTHECVFDLKVVSAEFLSEEATCQHADLYYLSCACGAIGEKTFTNGKKLEHNYGEVVDAKYEIRKPTCT